MKISKNKCYYCDKKIKGKKDKEANFTLIEVRNGYVNRSPQHAIGSLPIEEYSYYRCKAPCKLSCFPVRNQHVEDITERISKLRDLLQSHLSEIYQEIDNIHTFNEAEMKRLAQEEMKSYYAWQKEKR